MSMHLMSPAFSTLNIKKRKLKFKSAKEKQQHESYLAWKQELLDSLKPAQKTTPKPKRPSTVVPRETAHVPSKQDTGGYIPPKKETRVYNGERTLLGVATLHKSVMQPVFDAEYAKDVARMRRG